MTSTLVRPSRHHHVEHVMGTVFGLDIRDDGDWSDTVVDVVAWLHHVDSVFSTYRPGSDINRINRREVRATDADPLVVIEVLGLCAELQAETDGWFSAMVAGRLDPTGLVKGWAVERASTMLTEAGATNHLINGGGDIQAAGSPTPEGMWTVGIADPGHRDHVLTTVVGNDFAVATSGSAERGAHIVDPFTGRPATTLLSATVVGPSLTRADVYATAAAAMGTSALGWISALSDYECLLVTATGDRISSPGWARTP